MSLKALVTCNSHAIRSTQWTCLRQWPLIHRQAVQPPAQSSPVRSVERDPEHRACRHVLGSGRAPPAGLGTVQAAAQMETVLPSGVTEVQVACH